ncbi:MAG: hypothetical protein GC189_14120 [Alphaproteobacteria bacterium]|nr:hypothetical protein [Alphaproteobacteria bacterium]
MILRGAGFGFALWLAATLAFRFYGHVFFYPDERLQLMLLIGAPIAMMVLTALLLRLIAEARGDEAEAAIALAFPGMAMDVFVVTNFAQVFPNLDQSLSEAFAGLMLACYAAVIFTGLMLTQLAPQDERL